MIRLQPRLATVAVLALLAGRAAAQTTTAEQIDQYLKTSPPIEMPQDAVDGVVSALPDRQVHGEVSVAVGTGGYRSAYVRSDMPLGKTGTLSIAVESSRNVPGYGYGYGYGGYGSGYGRGYGRGERQSLGLGLAFGGDGATRCRPDSPVRADEWVDAHGCRREPRP